MDDPIQLLWLAWLQNLFFIGGACIASMIPFIYTCSLTIVKCGSSVLKSLNEGTVLNVQNSFIILQYLAALLTLRYAFFSTTSSEDFSHDHSLIWYSLNTCSRVSARATTFLTFLKQVHGTSSTRTIAVYSCLKCVIEVLWCGLELASHCGIYVACINVTERSTMLLFGVGWKCNAHICLLKCGSACNLLY